MRLIDTCTKYSLPHDGAPELGPRGGPTDVAFASDRGQGIKITTPKMFH